LTDSRFLALGHAWDLFDRCRASLTAISPGIVAAEPAGGVRRTAPLVSSLVIVLQARDPVAALDAIASTDLLTQVVRRSDCELVGFFERAEIEIHTAAPDDYGRVLFKSTGSVSHIRDVTARGLPDHPYATEQDLYRSVGLPFIPPELRHSNGEIEAAASGTLPALVATSDIRGDLHMHTTYSDGRNPVAAMVEGCRALGYEYMAITDHSSGAVASRTLANDAIARQRDDIEELRDRIPEMAILHGIEVDILIDGRLDLEDSVLEQFDIVLASLHEHARQDGTRLTARSVQAIRHPLVNMLCHPANQLVGRFSGYELDFEAIYAAAAETGTALEVDGAPSHLDLDGDRARGAIAAGVVLTIDSDCHRVEALGRQMNFGVGTARRGWVEPRHVLNTRPLEDVRAFIAAKRRGAKSG
jgi:DNA polymerase (family 10)